VILGAGLLVLAGLGLFVAGVLTGVTALYWACVGVCAVAAVLLIASRRSTGAPASTADTTASAAAAPPAGQTPAAPPRQAVEPATGTEATAPEEPPATPPATDTEHPAGVHATAHRTGPAGPSTGGSTAVGAHGSRGTHAAADGPAGVAAHMAEPGAEEVEVTDLLLVVDLTDEVLVVDEHPRYHLEGCRFLAGRETFALPLDEARTDGFTPCALCTPDRHLADRERARRAGLK
jgi:hypothetical protein